MYYRRAYPVSINSLAGFPGKPHASPGKTRKAISISYKTEILYESRIFAA